MPETALLAGSSPSPGTAPTPSRRSLPRVILYGALIGLALCIECELLYILFGTNLREVIPGELYRCAQPTARSLANFRQRYGIRTVVMLRGHNDQSPWYREELQGAEEQGLSVEVVNMSATRTPAAQTFRHLVEILDHAERPLLIHCQRGVDRTGLVCTLYLLLQTDATLEQARRQLSLRYLHINAGRTAAMGRVLDMYADWLAARSESHRPDLLRYWLREEYQAPQGAAHLELLTQIPPEGRWEITPTAHHTLGVRVWNDAAERLQLCAGQLGGLFLRWDLLNADRTRALKNGQGTLREATVPPGQSTDLQVYLPPVNAPGKYWLKLHLWDQQISGSCSVYGSEPLFVELEVR